MRKISLIFIMPFAIFLLNSCVVLVTSSMETVRKNITRNNPRVKAVGVITDWTRSDNKYLAVELILEDNKILFLPLMNYRKTTTKDPFYVGRIGNYAFATVYHIVRKQTNEVIVKLDTNITLSLSKLSARTGIRLDTMGDIINYYDEINAYVESLPIVDKDNYQIMFNEEKLCIGFFEETENNYVTIYHVKTIWNDEYYGTYWENSEKIIRRPDYNGNVSFTSYRFLGLD